MYGYCLEFLEMQERYHAVADYWNDTYSVYCNYCDINSLYNADGQLC